MAETPSLTSLCMEAISKQILRGDYNLENIYEIPSFLLDDLITRLPPLALHKLQEQLPCKSWWDSESSGDRFESSRKRAKFENMDVFDDTISENFNASWKRLFMSRWPDSIKHSSTPADWVADRDLQQCELTNDWRQKYWEAHVQDCIDEAAERAMLPSFDGCIGEITISDAILELIGISTRDYSKFCNHCEQFAKYARCMRLQNVFCSTEICKLLKGSKLQSLVLRRIKSNDHVDGLCKLLRQNCESLRTLEFIHCKLSSNVVNAICDSLHINGMQPHMVQNFSVKASSFLEKDMQSLPIGLISFLSSGRSLCSLSFPECRLGINFAKMLFNALFDASSCVSILDLSENNMFGGLTYMSGELPIFTSHFALGETLQSLRVLNLRGNNLHKSDVDGLVCGLYHIPNLETLDLSDNPITDAGVRSLTSCFGDTSQRCSLLSILKIENCELSCSGATQLLEVLLTLKKSLDTLSIADNELGSQVAPVLGKFMTESVKVLNIELIGLGSSGFVELEKAIGEEMKLVYLNISKNRGGIPTANCLSKIISRAPELVAVSAAYNFIPVESLTVICAALRIAKGKLEHLDLTGNERYELDSMSMMDEFQHNGRPIVIFPPSAPLNVPHDHDL